MVPVLVAPVARNTNIHGLNTTVRHSTCFYAAAVNIVISSRIRIISSRSTNHQLQLEHPLVRTGDGELSSSHSRFRLCETLLPWRVTTLGEEAR